MQVQTSILDNDVKLIQLDGRLDLQGVMEVELKFTAYAASEKAGVVVDLSQVPFLASIGLRMLLTSAKAVQKRGGKMVLLIPHRWYQTCYPLPVSAHSSPYTRTSMLPVYMFWMI